jgi:hypothetical protein
VTFGFALALQDVIPPAPVKGLFLDGLNVLYKPTSSSPARYAVPIETIAVTEAGPGSASSMSFTIDDPGVEVGIVKGQEVRYHDHVRDRPIFLGRVQSHADVPWGGGRRIAIKAIGIDVALDWMIVPALTIPAGTDVQAAIMAAVAAATGIGWPFQTRGAIGLGGEDGSANGLSGVGSITVGGTTTSDTIVFAGESLRAAIRKILNTMVGYPLTTAFSLQPAPDALISADGILHVYGIAPNNFAQLTINDVYAGPIVAAVPEWAEDFGGIPAGVYVTGASPAASGLVTRGDGIPGPIAAMSDSNLTTADQRDVAGRAYLARTGIQQRGAARLESFAWTTNIRAASPVRITDANLGLSVVNTVVAAITKTWTRDGLETWAVEIGVRRPAMSRQIRRLTAAVRP